jgi:hypothetical protein
MNAQPTKEPGGKAGTKLGLRPPKPVPVDAIWITARQVRRRYGDLSEMWLWRKLRDDPDFPQPYFNGHLRTWKVPELDAYDLKMATRSPKKKKAEAEA